jgi:hypothetical protein
MCEQLIWGIFCGLVLANKWVFLILLCNMGQNDGKISPLGTKNGICGGPDGSVLKLDE